MKLSDIKFDCRHFRGDIPCRPHKTHGVHCNSKDGSGCQYYDATTQKVLIIKLGAVGDVIRTTPILFPLRAKYPNAKIFWLTQTPSVVPKDVDSVIKYNPEGVSYLKSLSYDYVVNLDKDKEACALINSLNAKVKKGYILKDGSPYPADKDAEAKYLTGIFDDINKSNEKHYLEEIFEVSGFNYNGEKYILSSFSRYAGEWTLDRSKKIIGLNTGCGGRWTSRLWPDESWSELAKCLILAGCEVVFLGGEQEDEKNRRFASETGGKYPGYFTLEKFINLVDQCDLVVTGVTMAMHITLGLNKKIVLFNNIFNPREFELFGLGEIIQPDKECKCFYSPVCVNTEYQCMNFIKADRVLKTITAILHG
ncbi:MAG: glycosyltransferase family 9 protein [Ignavibacteria bacterium]